MEPPTLYPLAALLLLLQTAIIAALLIQRARRPRVEQALQDGQQRYTVATAAGGVGVWDWNFETNMVYIDPTIKAILGLDEGELTMRVEEWGARVHPQDLAAVTVQSQACLDGTVKEYHVEHRMLHKDGSVRWFLSRGSCVRRPDGAPHRMIGTKVDITARKRAEEAMRENQAVLEATNREIHDLAGRLIASQEVERTRIARDLHDDLSQQLAGLSIALSSFKRRLAALPGGADLEGDVTLLQQRTVALADDIRHVSHDLHPSVLRHAGLVTALESYCGAIQRRESLTVTFAATGDFSAISPDTALCLYRVAQEALRNVVAHAGAQRVDVLLRGTCDLAELSVVDDGKGFDISDTRKRRKGLGLVSITERVRLAGGGVSFVTELGKGTRVHVEVPTRGCDSGTAADGSATLAATS